MASSVYHINTPKTKNSCREILSLSNGERGAKMALEEIKRKMEKYYKEKSFNRCSK